MKPQKLIINQEEHEVDNQYNEEECRQQDNSSIWYN